MFHRFSGKTFIFVIGIVFALLSLQNTWDFLTKSLPGAQPQFLFCMMIVFEGGVFGWLALLTHGAGNVPRVVISAIMLTICAAAVGIAAFFMLGNMLGAGLGYKIPPAVLQWVPTITIGAYLATGAALILWLLANPEFHARMSHINTHGTAPANLRVVSLAGSDRSNGKQIAGAQTPLQIAAPAQPVASAGGWFKNAWRVLRGEAPQAGAEADVIDATNDQTKDDSLSSYADQGGAVPEMAEATYETVARTRTSTPHKRPVNRSQSASTGKRAAVSIEVLEMLDDRYPDVSDAELARKAGCSPATVNRFRRSREQ